MKRIKIISLFALIFVIQSCETEIPEIDTEAPRFSFRITGDGFEHTFNQESDFRSIQLNLKEDAEYTFLLTGGDDGGLKRLEMYYAPDYIEMDANLSGSWQQTSLSALTDLLFWDGNRSTPLTGTLLNGSFKANGDLGASEITFYLTDFGGSEGSSNATSALLNIFSGNHNTEIIHLR